MKKPIEFLARLREQNVNRSREAFCHQLHDWSALEWAGAAAGEMGEAANIAKKMRRGDPGEWKEKLADEIADVVLYLDLLAASEGIDLQAAIVKKFNSVSVLKRSDRRL